MDGQQDRAGVSRWANSPGFLRILPFALFMLFLAIGSALPPPEPAPPGQFDSRWIYAARTLAVGALLAFLWWRFDELHTSPRMGLADWALATVSGAVVFIVWIHLDEGWVVIGDPSARVFDPRQHAAEALHIPLTTLRLIGLAIVVPIAEELFWRSFLMRWVQHQDFLAVAPRAIGIRAIAVTSVLFAFEHTQWLAGLIAGAIYAWIYVRSGKLWVSIVSHAVTNTLLGVWILVTRDWRFW